MSDVAFGALDNSEQEARRSKIPEMDELRILRAFHGYIEEKISFSGDDGEVAELKQEVAQGLYDLFLALRETYPHIA